MIKRYITKLIGTGKTTEDSIRPEFLDTNDISCVVVGSLWNGFVVVEVDGDESTHTLVSSYPHTTEEHL